MTSRSARTRGEQLQMQPHELAHIRELRREAPGAREHVRERGALLLHVAPAPLRERVVETRASATRYCEFQS